MAGSQAAPAPRKPLLGFLGLWNISFGFFGIQIGFALQSANVSRIFQTLGASIDDLPILWVAGPVTGLLVQPVIGYLSDRTWGPLGRRRPYFLAGAVLASLALIAMPHASVLWIAAGLLWMLDASINVAMEPFRAFVGDMLDERQRTRGYAFQTAFIGAGAVVASLTPAILTNLFGVDNTAPAGAIPDAVRYAFYGGAVAFLGAVLWTVLSTREYSPEQLAAFGETVEPAPVHADAAPPIGFALACIVVGAANVALVAWLGLDKPLYILGFGLAAFGLAQIYSSWRMRRHATPTMLGQILGDLWTMPPTMRQLALIQFLSWFALFVMWIYATPVVTRYQFGSADPATQGYNDGADWVGVLFAVYNGVAAFYAFVLPGLAARWGLTRLHLVNLAVGGLALASFAVIRSPDLLLLPMVGIGMAWASILTVPYAILCGALPQAKLGIYMGLFNLFIVLPQLVVSAVMGSLSRHLYPDAPIVSFLIAGGFMVAAGLASLRLPTQRS
ncbi:MFS transporter [Sphingosinicella sp. LHD-64]|uniref:MFS transporter n=1 Tax=Sphingosinicella sp. LHD-64 TaxID=3072139 RepID=UPI00280DD635|nr:MFS transporter [Sphingosinicella sp. LHD-64]MDQ8756791.1 MFS transporter [Sphingosinicella sp. LHD-64]